jgi:hypothetical protein
LASKGQEVVGGVNSLNQNGQDTRIYRTITTSFKDSPSKITLNGSCEKLNPDNSGYPDSDNERLSGQQTQSRTRSRKFSSLKTNPNAPIMILAK